MGPSSLDMGARSVSVIMPAFNEAENLASTIDSVRGALSKTLFQYEIIVVDDGSQDNTGKKADELANGDSHIKVLHNPQNMGYGYTFLRGVSAATCEYIQLIPADGEIPQSAIEAIVKFAGQADLVLPYFTNFHIRSIDRRIISWCYTALLNVIFLHNIHYYNGPFLIRTNLLRSVNVNTRGFAFMAAIILRLLKRKICYVQVGVMLTKRRHGKSNLTIQKIITAAMVVLHLAWEINVRRPGDNPAGRHQN